MLNPNFATYSGQENKQVFSYFHAGSNFFLVFEIKDKIDKDYWQKALNLFIQKLKGTQIVDLAGFESFLYEQFKELNIPLAVSYACGYLKDNLFYLKTSREGVVYLKRGKDFAKIIDKDNCASGMVKEGDLFIFSSLSFLKNFKDNNEFKSYLNAGIPEQISKNLSHKLHPYDKSGSLAFFLTFPSERAQEQLKSNLFKDKKITFIAAIIIFIILIWSVVLGYQRRQVSKLQKKLVETSEKIKHNLNVAKDEASSDLARAQTLISESKEELATLKKDLQGSKKEEVTRLEELINRQELEILKKEEKSSQEFFDLTIVEKQAQGDKISLSGENLVILNKKGSVYTLSLIKKSVDKKNINESKKAQSIVFYNNAIFLYLPNEGIYKIIDDKLKKVLDYDKEWGTIVDFNVYNDNLYLLDKGKNDLYKYSYTDGGYSVKKSYFGPDQPLELNDSNSFAIDSAIYIGIKNRVLKYLGGARDKFDASIPESDFTVSKVFTNKNVGKIYILDKAKGAVYILNKDGSYEKQINSAIFKNTDDFVVFDNGIFTLTGSKIYRIGLE